MISAIKVLNSVTALGTDVSVGSDGIVNIASVASTDAYNLRGITVTTPQTEASGVITITPTVAALATYTFYVNGFSMSTGLPKVMTISFVSAAGATRLSISTQIVTAINADADFSVSAAVTGLSLSEVATLTAKATQPFFVVGGVLANIDSYSSAGATNITSNLSAANGTVGRAVRGSVAYLQNKYAYATAGNALNYNELALLTSGFFYTEVVIEYISTTPSGSGAFKGEISTLQAVVLVRANADGNVPFVSTTANYADLLGSYGTITGLAAGYRVVGALMTAATATSTNTSGVQTLNSGGLATVNGIVGGDYIVSVSTPVVHKVISTLTENTYLASTTTTLTASSPLNSFKWRNLPV